MKYRSIGRKRKQTLKTQNPFVVFLIPTTIGFEKSVPLSSTGGEVKEGGDLKRGCSAFYVHHCEIVLWQKYSAYRYFTTE
jgi:hypothetical protein